MEKKEIEGQERRRKEEDELHKVQIKQEQEDNVCKLKTALRMTPLGYDRYHRRYWSFNGMAGLYVEDGWMTFSSWRPDIKPGDDTTPCDDNTGDGESNEVEAIDSEKMDDDSQDVVIVKEVKSNEERTTTDVPIHKRNKLNSMFFSFRDVPYNWTYYDNIEDITAILDSLAPRGIRESTLHQVLNSEKFNIEKNLKKKR
ncbi:hypothetical protein QZH41_012408 [Actinostola sp. cb2023]|nr:hypothetical protein QZH41_012408 [Actinostola sp. cb2023]